MAELEASPAYPNARVLRCAACGKELGVVFGTVKVRARALCPTCEARREDVLEQMAHLRDEPIRHA